MGSNLLITKSTCKTFELNIDGYKLKFFTTPYCHSPGAFVTYDLQTKVLFSSDLFGGLEESWHFYADENYYKEIEGFHMAYMPSKDILNYALRKIENLDIELIAPQHGSIIKREHIKPLIDKMKEMECGLYIEKQYSENLTETIQKIG
jgi:flavorubredoxin